MLGATVHAASAGLAPLDRIPDSAWIVVAGAILLVALVLFWRHRHNRAALAAPLATPEPPPVEISASDFNDFEALIQELNDCWRSRDAQILSRIATPRMATRLNSQLQALLAQDPPSADGAWQVHELSLLRGDLIAAWHKDGVEHAQMNLRLSTLESSGHGETPRRYVSREIWNFERTHGQHWRIAGVRSVD